MTEMQFDRDYPHFRSCIRHEMPNLKKVIFFSFACKKRDEQLLNQDWVCNQPVKHFTMILTNPKYRLRGIPHGLEKIELTIDHVLGSCKEFDAEERRDFVEVLSKIPLRSINTSGYEEEMGMDSTIGSLE